VSSWHCPLCGGVAARQLFASHDQTGAAAGVWSVMRCQNCALPSLQPRPTQHELSAFYPPGYAPFAGPVEEVPGRMQRWLLRRHYNLRCQVVRRAGPTGGRLLDIGCATGNFVQALGHDRRWQCLGSDLSRQALAVARRQGLMVWCSSGETACLAPESCDIVTLWEVIEHLPDPRAMLADIHRVLRPGGLLVLSTPNSASVQARLWRQYWAGWEVPRHLQVFSLATLRRLLVETGFAITQRGALPMERFYAVESATRWARQRLPARIATRLAQLAWGAGLAAWPLLRLIDYSPAASALVLVAQRRNGKVADV